MGRIRGFLLIISGIVFVSVLTGAVTTVWATSDVGAVHTGLQQIMNEPESFNGREVEFYCRFATVGKLFRLNDDEVDVATHLNIAVWTPQAELWDKEARKGALPTLYISKKNAVVCSAISKLNMYSRVLVKGRVYGVYASLPWIEVLSVRPAFDGRMDDDILRDLAEAVSSGKKGYAGRSAVLFDKIAGYKCAAYLKTFAAAEARKCRAAVAAARREQQQPSTRSEDFLEKARSASRADRIMDAYNFYQQAIKLQQESVNKRVLLLCELSEWARQQYENKRLGASDIADIAQELEKVSELSGDKENVLYELANLSFVRANNTSAEEWVHKLLVVNPQHAGANKLLSELMAAKIKPASKVELVYDVQSDSVNERIALATRLYEEGKFAAALSEYQTILKQNAKLTKENGQQVKMGVVGCLVSLKRNDEAAAYIAKMMQGGADEYSAGGATEGHINTVSGIDPLQTSLSEFEEMAADVKGINPISEETAEQSAKAEKRPYVVSAIPAVNEIAPVSLQDETDQEKTFVTASSTEMVEKEVSNDDADLPSQQNDLPEWAR